MICRASAGFVFMLSGCVALSSVQPADTLGRGRLQVGIEPGLSAAVTPRAPLLPQPVMDVSLRFGALERLDLGARLGQSGLEVSTKVMLTPRRSPVLVSVAPALGGTVLLAGDTPAVVGQSFSAALPLLLGLRLGPHQLVLGPRAQLMVVVASDPNQPALRALLVGGSLGVALHVSRAVTVLPELAVAPVVLRDGALPPGVPGVTGGEGVPVQLRLGVLLGEPQPVE
ncbi:MAG: hypothetical protein JNJ54_08970 [Myxococcaceae bacterium]|nr:hypothetical protein [Myxococcaceae bacterium]